MEILDLELPLRHFPPRWRALLMDPGGRREVAVSICASFTVEPLLPYLGVYLAERGLLPRFTVAPYNQIYQSLLDPGSALRRQAAHVTLVLPRAEELCAQALGTLGRLDPRLIEEAREGALSEVDRLCQALTSFERSGTSGVVLIGTLPDAPSTPLGVLDASHPASQAQLLRAMNLRLFEHVRGTRQRLVDVAGLVARFGTLSAYDERMWHLSRCPFSAPFLRFLGAGLSRAIAPLFISAKKVVVLDLDNTLWGGILGEDGAHGIAIGENGVGAAYAAFQEALLDLRSQGVLLCVASKNNEKDALEVLDHHPAMRLRRHHLSAWRIGWQPKSESLRQLARELSLSLQSFVFIDDSQVECEEIRQMNAGVTVIRLPEDPSAYVALLRSHLAFDRMTLTDEDLVRAEQYAQEQRRRVESERAQADPLAWRRFLHSLDLRVSVRRVGAGDVMRAAQLTQKTNQFNLTTIRRSEADIEALLRDPGARLYLAEVTDRFGSYGQTGLAILRWTPPHFELDTFLLSCRVLGRGVEGALLQAIVRDLDGSGARGLRARFIPTERNQVASGFLPAHGFMAQGDGSYLLDPLSDARIEADHITLSTPGGDA